MELYLCFAKRLFSWFKAVAPRLQWNNLTITPRAPLLKFNNLSLEIFHFKYPKLAHFNSRDNSRVEQLWSGLVYSNVRVSEH